MNLEASTRERSSPRWMVVALVTSLIGVLLVAGFTFANSIGAAKVAGNAASLHWANAATGTSALTRAALAQALTFTQLHARDQAADSDLTYAIEQVDLSLEEVRALEEAGAGSGSVRDLGLFRASAERVKTSLLSGDMVGAVAEIDNLEVYYNRLVESLQAEQDAIQQAIEANTAAGQRINGLIVFVVTLVIPTAAVVVYWRVARRQISDHQIKVDLELETERSVNRAKDQFIAGLSHELRTPLTSIYGFAEILSEAEEPDQQKELAQIIANEAAEMSRMVDDLLTASRFETTGVEVELVPTRVATVVDSAIAPFERAGLVVQREVDAAVAMTDGSRLRHVLVNLLSNAARHGGGEIGVVVSTTEATVDIEVWDTGPGVPEDRVEKLFVPFVNDGSTPLIRGSVGLGLAVASRLAEKLSGTLSYQRFGGKTFFILSVPVFADADFDVEDHSVADVIRSLS